MILEAFSKRLLQEYPPANFSQGETQAEGVLHAWLAEILSKHPRHGDQVAHVIHAEIVQIHYQQKLYFEGRSKSGRQLLHALHNYCKSYEHWQFSRWVHRLRASDFSLPHSH